MKRLLLIPIIALAALGFSTTSASAANCDGVHFYGSNPHNGGGSVGFKVQFGTCTDVDQVRVKYTACGIVATCTLGNYRYYDGFYDGDQTVFVWAYLNGGTSDITMPYPGQCCGAGISPQGGVTVSRPCWYSGTHGLGAHFWYQIHGATSHQWGFVYEYYPNITYYVPC